MAATIQNIELPKKPRALDTSSGKQVVSQNLLADSGFTGITQAESTPGTPWTTGEGWTIAGGEASCDGSQSEVSYLYNTDTDLTDPENKFWEITYEITARSAGTVRAMIGGYGPETAAQSAVDTYTEIVGPINSSSNNQLYITASSDFIGSVDNISVKSVETFSNNNHGKIYSGRALEFDGVTDYFQNNRGAGLAGVNGFANGVPWTFACWMYFDSAGDGEDHFVGHDLTTQNHLTFNHSGNILRFRDNSADYYTFSSTSLNEDTWYRIVVTTDGTKLTAYANGVVYGTIEANQANVAADDNFDNTTMEFSGWGCPYSSGGNRAGHFMGMMSDGQVWDAIWSADDAAYDYANPESLALNASGTALTEANLKIWYPMQDGHRGQQSYILDGANTGLADTIVTNGTFTGITQSEGVTGSEWQTGGITSNGWTISGGKATASWLSSSSIQLNQTISVVAGGSYKISITIEDYVRGQLQVQFGSQAFASNNISANGTFTYYVNSTGAGDQALRLYGINTSQFSIADISIQPINDKHHATTVFYGDPELSDHLIAAQKTDLVDNLDSSDDIMVFADAVTDGCDGTLGSEVITGSGDRGMDGSSVWTEGTGWAVQTGTPGKAVKTGGGAESLCTHTGTGAAVANRWYKVQYITDSIAQEDGAGASAGFNVNFGSSDGLPISTANGVHSRLIYTSDTDKLVLNANANTNIIIDDVSVKLADGWVICENHVNGAATCDGLATGGTMTFVNTDTGENGRIALPITATTGKTYRVKADCIDSSSQTMKLGLSGTCFATSTDADPTFGSAITVGNTGYSNEVVCVNGTLCIYVENNVTTEDTKVVFDNLTVQEVGTASGWTDADQQLDIAQPALQSYNELAWFGGVTDAVNCTSGTSIDDVFDSGGTFSAWIYANKLGDSDFPRIFDKSQNMLYLKTESGETSKLAFQSVNSGDNTEFTTTNYDIEFGQWQHVAITYNASSPGTTPVAYVNGVEVAISSYTPGTSTRTSDASDVLYIGNNAAGTRGFSGCITEASFWEEILTATEILELYNEGKALDATAHSQADELKAYWRNNGLSTWTDLAGNSNDGTVNNLTETLLIPQGVDGSRDAQGFIMNKARNTSSLNMTKKFGATSVDVDGYVDLGSTRTVADGDAFSLCVWLKPDDLDSNNYFIGGGAEDWIKIQSSTTILVGATSITDTFTIDAIAAKEWVHVAIVKKANDVGNIYINGDVMVSTIDFADKAFDYRHLGARQTDAYTFRGQVDGMLIYDDELTGPEVLRNYKATKGSHRN